jgi:hypothetical protein
VELASGELMNCCSMATSKGVREEGCVSKCLKRYLVDVPAKHINRQNQSLQEVRYLPVMRFSDMRSRI